MKRVVGFSINDDVDDRLTKVAKALGWSKSEIVEKALRLVFKNPSFNKAISNIERIQNETEVLR